jgi:uncharacterized protein YjcR
MAKSYRISKIKYRRSYDFNEITELLGIHISTVRAWRKEGLETLEDTRSPYLVMGKQLKTFLHNKQAKRKTHLKSNEVYCLVCRKGIVPVEIAEVINGIVGGNKQSLILKGKCPNCNRPVNRFISKESKT